MNPHLRFKIDWISLTKVFDEYNDSDIQFSSGKCKKIQIHIQNIKYIYSDMVCYYKVRENIIKKNQKTKYFLEKEDKFNITCEKKEYLKNFETSFNKTLHEFKESLSRKVMEIDSVPEGNLRKEYLDEKVDIYLRKDINSLSWGVKSVLNHTNTKNWMSNYIELYALSSSKNFIDIRTIIELDKKNIISLLAVFYEIGDMGKGNCFNTTITNLKCFYLTMNLIISNGYFDTPEKWGVMNNYRVWQYLLYEEHTTLTPILRYKYFICPGINKLESKKFIGESCIKNKHEINKLLKGIFRFLYTWEFLKDYTEKKYNVKLYREYNMNH